MKAAEQIYQNISRAQENGQLVLPSLPELAIKIRDAVNSDTRSVTHIARLVQLDPGLAARLVQIANSASYRRSVPASDCQQAIIRLGMKVTRDLVTCLITHNVFQARNPLVKPYLMQLWKHSAHVAAISYVLAQVTPGLSPDKALLAGLVHDIGVLPVVHYVADDSRFLLDGKLLDALSVRLRAELGENILSAWQFDEALIAVPREAENWQRRQPGPPDYCDLVIVAQRLSFTGTACENKVPALVDIPAFQKFGIAKLGPDACREVLDGAKQDIQNIMRHLQA
ncbi:MAG: HDOD domain-containing protein [Thioalkalispiraceae bacterium]|jgi:HD-like signal output (HDOD) protein